MQTKSPGFQIKSIVEQNGQVIDVAYNTKHGSVTQENGAFRVYTNMDSLIAVDGLERGLELIEWDPEQPIRVETIKR